MKQRATVLAEKQEGSVLGLASEVQTSWNVRRSSRTGREGDRDAGNFSETQS